MLVSSEVVTPHLLYFQAGLAISGKCVLSVLLTAEAETQSPRSILARIVIILETALLRLRRRAHL